MDFDLDAKTDEDFFGALKRRTTNLGHLFEQESQRGEQQDTLKYKPTKAATGGSNANNSLGGRSAITSPTTTMQAWQTLLAKVAQGYKEGVNVGKVGVALLQNLDKNCRIIVYRAKLNVLSTCTLRADMPQVHRRNNYLQYYDDDFVCWSLYFEADANTEEFVDKLIELNIAIKKVDAEEKKESHDLSTDSEYMAEEQTEVSAGNQFKIREKLEKPAITASKPTTKSMLITRMAKMGEQTLPKLPQLPTHVESSVDTTDSSDTEVITTRKALAPTQHKAHQPSARSSNRALAKAQALPVGEISYQPGSAVAAVGALESQFMQMMLTENRTHNSELRMNVGKLESKVEKVLDKIELLHSSASAQTGNKEDELLALEEKVLELKKENRKLRQAIEEKPEDASCAQILQLYSVELAEINLANVESLERLVGDLLRQRATLHDQLEQWERDLAVKNKELQTHQTRLDDEQDMLAKTIGKRDQLEEELKSYQERLIDKEKLECDLRHQLAVANKECIAQRQLYEECKQKEAQANDLIQELRAQNEQLRNDLADKPKTESGVESTSADSKLPVEKQIETVLKRTMNNLYGNLAAKLENIVPMQKNAVIAIIGKTIREETAKAMNELKK